MLSKAELDQMAELEAKATPGMWFGQYEYDGIRTICKMRSTDTLFCVNQQIDAGEPLGMDATKENAAFISAARSFIPAALKHIKEQAAKIEELEAEIAEDNAVIAKMERGESTYSSVKECEIWRCPICKVSNMNDCEICKSCSFNRAMSEA